MTSHGNDLIITTVQRTNQNTRWKTLPYDLFHITVRNRLKMQNPSLSVLKSAALMTIETK